MCISIKFTFQLQRVVLGILLFVCAGPSYGQTSVFFDHFTTNEGLSQSDVNCIFQDNLGFMWFGTHDGLNKYNGYEFTVHKPEIGDTNSISSNLVFDIAGDSDGNLWIGTTGSGLNYFDRSTETFTQFKNNYEDPESLSNDHIIKVFLDSKKRLWVGTRKGLNMTDLKKSSDRIGFLRLNLESSEPVLNVNFNMVSAICEDSIGQIWVGGPTGLFKLTRDSKGDYFLLHINEAIGLPEVGVTSIAQNADGQLLIGTTDGLFMLRENEKSTSILKIHEGYYNDLQIDQDGNLWGATNDGLVQFKCQKDDGLLIYDDQFKYDPKNPGSLTKNVIKSLFLDKAGILWIGTNGGGINKLDPLRKQFKHIRKTSDTNSLSYDKIRSIYEDSNGTIWIGTEGGGFNMLQKRGNAKYSNFKSFDVIKNTFAITEVSSMPRKTLLVGGEGSLGLYKIDISRPNGVTKRNIVPFQNFKHSVFSLLEDHNKTLWIGTYGGGLHRWTPNGKLGSFLKSNFTNNTLDSTSISDNIIRNVLEDRQGNLWIATGNGLSLISANQTMADQPNFRNFRNTVQDSSSISHNYILSLYESTNGDIWIGTFGGGLNRFVPGKDGQKDKFIAYKELDGLPNNVIKGILEDDNGHLWLSTNKGLSKFDPIQKTFKNYNVNDGLQSNEFQELACLKRNNGEMLFGGVNGFNAFFPKDIKDNSQASETVITNFSIQNKPIATGEKINGRTVLKRSIEKTDQIRLKHNENSFSFEFVSLHYAAPIKNRFAYKLEGFDDNWVQAPSNNRFATYTNIAPGEYTLKVKSSNNDGLWDQTPSKIEITVVPPFWKTNAAYIVYTLLFLGILAGFWKYTIISASKKHQLEMEYLEKEKQDELQRVKLEFFTNISHEFRTPLTLIKAPLEYLQKNSGKITERVVQEQYVLMQKNTNNLLKLVNQLLDFRKINQGKMRLVVRHTNIVAFIKEVAEPFQFLAHKKSIDFTVNSSEDFIRTWFDHDALEKITNNLLSNAFKFTPEFGKITINISKQNDSENGGAFVLIEVKDSGTGIKSSKLNTIFEKFYVEKTKKKINAEGVGIGLAFTKSLIELHQGSIQVSSKKGLGANFIVQLPMSKAAYESIPEISCKEVFDNDFLVRSSETESFAIGINDELEDLNLSKSRPKLPVLLIVDDNPDILMFIKQALSEQYTIFEAENGKKGLEVAKRVTPNLIITDLIMPIMDGIEFCEVLKTTKTTSHIPLVMLTAKSSQESEIEGLKYGADAYIRKPFNVELLELKLTNILKHREELRKRFKQEVTLQPKEITVTSLDEKFLQNAVEVVEKHMMNTDFNVEMLVREMGYSRSNLYLKFKELTGLSSSEFIRNIRLKRAIQFLDSSDLSVKEIMFRTGFSTASYFSKCFKKQFGVVPSEYVRGIKGDNKTANL
ncbi:hybrid sensor histidine kinase/response regulator transcription factor [Kriegella aquimaris]|uniref:histidine kinase n=1 Tax=Kriegella aquimaris TaxID=192904 RepID=A0A1G9S5X9_9FLAO|nr:two-component regulator propeller domain-containing protein [Kriegella aquimaris]SDM30165.1 Signal transduction histidine kinase [Kriegella aquimaris]